MDKNADVVEEERIFKKMSVLPDEKDFVDAILSLKDLQRKAAKLAKASPFKFEPIREHYREKIKFVERSFFRKLSKVSKEFANCLNETPPGGLLFQRFHYSDLKFARRQLNFARDRTHSVAMTYVLLLRKDDCDSVDKCKSLTVSALGQDMLVQFTNKNLEDENAAATLTKNKKHFVTEAYDTFAFDIRNAAAVVPPETLAWLEDLEREDGF
ncbi:probable mediator of RNA polymerase II transcription subunit 26a [Capsella rubella]|uniref:probable mediator of RNA polymerase II transcription subunit 26a n=1 Tax=Capsella rubella TaxID=81985 RepID=UPI000CD55E15|nr:probable mediator of RNA polymerase II transcription subunit 26a [Capsella rubella]